MSNLSPFEAGFEAARKAIADRARSRKKRDLVWTVEDRYAYSADWEQFLEGWMKAIREDKERQLSWDDFYFPTCAEDEH